MGWDEVKKQFNSKSNIFIYTGFFIIAIIAVYIRTLNIPLLKDVTTGKYISIELDTFAFHRYSEYILQHGSLMANDVMRYVPYGYDPRPEFSFLTNFLVYSYKILHIFFSNLTFDFWFILYPVVCFLIMLIAFFFLVKVLFDNRVALLSTAFLAFSPIFLLRTIAGFSDKEAFALMTMTFAMLFYVSAWKTKSLKISLLLGLLSGIFSAFTGLVWGGVIYLFLLFGIFGLIMVFLLRYNENGFYSHLLWYFSMVIVYLVFNGRLDLKSFLIGVGILPATLSVVLGLILLKRYEVNYLKKVYEKIPREIFVLLIVSIFVTFLSFLTSINLPKRIYGFVYTYLFNPSGVGRWGLTIMESKEAYLVDWQIYLGFSFFYLFVIASLVLAYILFKNLAKYKNYFFFSFAFFLFGLLYSKYSIGSILDGTSFLSKSLLLVSPLLFIFVIVYYYFYGFYRNKDLYKNILELDNKFLFVLLWFIIAAVAAKTKIRLMMMLIPVTSIIGSYFIILIFNKIVKLRLLSKPIKIFSIDLSNPQYIRVFSLIVLFLFLLSPFAPIVNSIPILNKVPIINSDGILVSFVKLSYSKANHSGPVVSHQLLNAMSWVRENTPRDAVFASWWDYGYWIQTLGKRATISDGGNARGAINYFTGRYLLTSNNDTETLGFLYANNVTHFIILSDDIVKYNAYSLIGSNLDYDRYSWINPFWMIPQETKKNLNLLSYVYRTNIPFDDDFTFNNIRFNRKKSGIGGLSINYKIEGNDIKPINAIAYLANTPTNFYPVPVNCVIINGKEFNLANNGIGGCFFIVPLYLSATTSDPLGSGFYISEKVKNSLFYRYYILGKINNNFELVYADTQSFAADSLGIDGPIKIWKINYPKDIKDNPFYRQTTLPDERLYYINNKY